LVFERKINFLRNQIKESESEETSKIHETSRNFRKMNCVITVKGDGVGKYGHPKTDQTRTIKEFLVDNTKFYIAVTKHLKTCNVCDIEEILRYYLARRIQKFEGKTSIGLTSRALVLEKLAEKKKNPVPKSLVNEFIWRNVPPQKANRERLSNREKFLNYKLWFSIQKNLTSVGWQVSPAEKAIARIAFDSKSGNIDDQELEDLIKTVEIIYD
jgi:hypothetical protein